MDLSARIIRLVAALALLLTACGGGGGGGGNPPTGLSYSDENASYPVCVAVTPNTPTVGGGAVLWYEILPPLPAGLTLDTQTGVISGAPTHADAPQLFTVTANNNDGAAAMALSIHVSANPPLGLDYGGVAAFYVGVDSELFAPQLASGVASSFLITAGALPEGLALDASSGVLSGAPLHALDAGPPTLTIEATNCEGASTSADVVIEVRAPFARTLYVANDGEGTLSSFVLDAAGGILRSNGFELLDDTQLADIATTPDGAWLFASAADTLSLRSFACDADDGEPHETGAWVDMGALPALDLAVELSGRFLYALTNEPAVHQFAIDPESGLLTPLAPSFVTPGREPGQLALHPRGGFVYVSSALDATLTCYAIGAGGALEEFEVVPAGAGANGIALTPDGARLYVANAVAATLSAYDVSPTTGLLSELAGSPFASVEGTSPNLLAVDADGTHLYVAHGFDPLLESYAIGAAGALAHDPAGSLALDLPATRFDIDPTGGIVYAGVDGAGFAQLAVAGGGLLAPTSASPLVGRLGAGPLAFQAAAAPASLEARNVYAVRDEGRIAQLGLSASGEPTALSPASVANSGSAPCWIELHPKLDLALVAAADAAGGGELNVFDVDASGALTQRVALGNGTGAVSVHIDPSGRWACVLRGTSPGALLPYAIDPLSGAFSALTAVATGNAPRPAAVHSGGRLVSVPCFGDGTLETYAIDPLTGEVSLTDVVATSAPPTHVVATSSGAYVLALAAPSGVLDVFAVDALGGTLQLVGSSTLAANVAALALDPLGPHALEHSSADGRLHGARLDAAAALFGADSSTLAPAVFAGWLCAPGARDSWAVTAAGALRHVSFSQPAGFTWGGAVDVGATSGGALGLRLGVR